MSAPGTFNVKKLTRSRIKARIALFGPTNCGKTWTSMQLMRHLCDGPILFVDTEKKTAGLYAQQFNYDGRIDVIDDLTDLSPTNLTRVLEFAASRGYEGVIIDSFTHFWTGTKEEADRIAKRSPSGNTFAAWKEVTPMHNRMVDSILEYPGHVIVTMRVKMEYVTEKDDKGKTQIRKVGLDPEQRGGIEYEFDIAASMDVENTLVITKSRCDALRGYVENRPGAKFAKIVRDWCEEGDADQVLTDPSLILNRYQLNEVLIDKLKGECKAKGHKFSEVLIQSWAAGVRGSDTLSAYIGGLPKKGAEMPKAPREAPTEQPQDDLLEEDLEAISKMADELGLDPHFCLIRIRRDFPEVKGVDAYMEKLLDLAESLGTLKALRDEENSTDPKDAPSAETSTSPSSRATMTGRVEDVGQTKSEVSSPKVETSTETLPTAHSEDSIPPLQDTDGENEPALFGSTMPGEGETYEQVIADLQQVCRDNGWPNIDRKSTAMPVLSVISKIFKATRTNAAPDNLSVTEWRIFTEYVRTNKPHSFKLIPTSLV